VQNLRQTKAYLLLIFGIGLLLLIWQRSNREKLVVYCAHDAEFAEAILRKFEQQTGIPVVVKYDTEATKSLGLTEQIIQDGAKPRCDVFWNNEMLGTMDLAERGLLEPYPGEGWKRIPTALRDPQGRWAGFAARLRMKIRNTERPNGQEPMLSIVDGKPSLDVANLADNVTPPPKEKQFSRFAIAKPLYGTTLTHYAVLWQVWGPEHLQFWHTESRARGLREAAGNAMVRDLVASGECSAGFTDTDDYFEARDHQKPVAAEPVFVGDGKTICIPNTVAIIHGTRHPGEARQLADFLLSAQTEVALARSASRQIPVGPLDEKQKAALPEEVRALIEPASRAYPLAGLLKARNDCLAWLKAQYLN
jgi:iron(III) transport system substrate-binding protein